MKSFFFIAILVVLTQQSYGQTMVSLSLQETIEYAINNNVEIKTSELAIEKAEQQIIETRAEGLPQINLGINYTHYLQRPNILLPTVFEELVRLGNEGQLPHGYNNRISFLLKNNIQAGVQLQTMIFDGRYFAGLKTARLYRDLVKSQFALKKKEIKYQVIQAYIPVLIIEESLTILNKNLVSIQVLLEETEKLYQGGFVEQLDIDRLVLSLSSLQTEKETLLSKKQQSLLYLKLVVNYPEDQDMDIDDSIDNLLTTFFVKNSNERDTALYSQTHRLDYKIAIANQKLASSAIDYVYQSYLPSLSLNVAYDQSFQGEQLFGDNNSFWAPTAMVGLSLNVPIFDGFGKRAKIQKAKLEQEISNLHMQTLIKQISTKQANATIQYKSVKKQLEQQNKNLALAKKIHRISQIKYREGIGSSLEVHQSEQDLFRMQKNYLLTLHDLLKAKVLLEQSFEK